MPKAGRAGFGSLTMYLRVHEVERLLEFVRRVFHGEQTNVAAGSGGGHHYEVRLGDSMLMLGGGGSWTGTARPAALHVYVPDVDATYRRAIEEGAKTLYEPQDQPYGDRECAVEGPMGNCWFIATHRNASHIPEGLGTVTPYFHARDAAAFMEFLTQAFGAKEEFRSLTPEGMVRHAKMRIGDSVLELAEAHNHWQPLPAAIYLYVDNADAVCKRAQAAGAKLLFPAADQLFGDRMGGIEDKWGNEWFIATHHHAAAQ